MESWPKNSSTHRLSESKSIAAAAKVFSRRENASCGEQRTQRTEQEWQPIVHSASINLRFSRIFAIVENTDGLTSVIGRRTRTKGIDKLTLLTPFVDKFYDGRVCCRSIGRIAFPEIHHLSKTKAPKTKAAMAIE